ARSEIAAGLFHCAGSGQTGEGETAGSNSIRSNSVLVQEADLVDAFDQLVDRRAETADIGIEQFSVPRNAVLEDLAYSLVLQVLAHGEADDIHVDLALVSNGAADPVGIF